MNSISFRNKIVYFFLILNFIFRLNLLYTIPLPFDNVDLLLNTRDIVQANKLILIGPPLSKGGNLGPIIYYFSVPFYLLSDNPYFFNIIIMMFETASVCITYFFVKKFFNENSAMFMLFLYSINLHKMQANCVFHLASIIPFLTILFFYFLFSFFNYNYNKDELLEKVKNKSFFYSIRLWGKVILEKNKTSSFLLFIFLLISLQIHATSLFLLLPAILILIFFKVKARYILIITCLTLVLFHPLIISELNSFSNLKSYAPVFEDKFGNSLKYFSLTIFSQIYFISSELTIPGIIELIVFFFAFLYLLIRILKSAFRNEFCKFLVLENKYILLLFWILLPVLSFLVINEPALYYHHFNVTLPANFIVMGIFLHKIANFLNFFKLNRNKIINILTHICLVIIFCFNTYYVISIYGLPRGELYYINNITKRLVEESNSNLSALHNRVYGCNLSFDYDLLGIEYLIDVHAKNNYTLSENQAGYYLVGKGDINHSSTFYSNQAYSLYVFSNKKDLTYFINENFNEYDCVKLFNKSNYDHPLINYNHYQNNQLKKNYPFSQIIRFSIRASFN